MSVLIKGMEMPKSCGDCPFDYDCFCCAITLHNFFILDENFDFTTERASDCPLVEVPTPHGRLIDASQFEVFGYDAIKGSFDDGVAFVLNKIDDAPTVIEEEE